MLVDYCKNFTIILGYFHLSLIENIVFKRIKLTDLHLIQTFKQYGWTVESFNKLLPDFGPKIKVLLMLSTATKIQIKENTVLKIKRKC